MTKSKKILDLEEKLNTLFAEHSKLKDKKARLQDLKLSMEEGKTALNIALVQVENELTQLNTDIRDLKAQIEVATVEYFASDEFGKEETVTVIEL